MIGRLRGKLVEKRPPLLLIDVGGVYYEVFAPMSTFYRLPEAGTETMLYTHLVVREDAQLLYGFSNARERELFRALIRVNGVGPKLALTILSGIEPDEFVQCVQEEDAARLVCLPGLGKKTADRLIVEMRDRLSDWQANAGSVTIEAVGSASITQDAISALTALGYKPQVAAQVVRRLKDRAQSREDLIRLSLQEISGRGR